MAAGVGGAGGNMVYDSATSQLLLFGGVETTSCSSTSCTAVTTNGTAQYVSGTGWVAVGTGYTAPSVRWLASMAYDADLGVGPQGAPVLFGGFSSSNTATSASLNDTWAWTGTRWLAAGATAMPPQEAEAALAEYGTGGNSGGSGELVLFGGNVANSTWVYDTNTPTATVAVQAPQVGKYLAPGDPAVVDVGFTNMGAAATEPVIASVTFGSGDVAAANGSVYVQEKQNSSLSGGASLYYPVSTTTTTGSGSSTTTKTTTLPPCLPPTQSASTPSCSVSADDTVNVSNLQIPAGETAIVQIEATIGEQVTGCEDESVTAGGQNAYGGIANAVASGAQGVQICGGGLGLENYWTYNSTPVGPAATASVNVADGNLVVSQTDSTEVDGHGALGLVLRRTYNSQDDVSEPEAGGLASVLGNGQNPGLGDGWQFNVGQTDTAASSGLDVAGLQIPSGELPSDPAAVTYVDRDGTRHLFTLASSGVELGGNLADINVDATGLTGALARLVAGLTRGGLPFGAATGSSSLLCVDAIYDPPPGVDFRLYRYVSVSGSGSGSSSACSTPPSSGAVAVVGWSVVRADGLRYDFSADGQLLDMVDRAGNELVYTYQTPLASSAASNVVDNPGYLGGLMGVWECSPSMTPGPSQAGGCVPPNSGLSASPTLSEADPHISIAYGTTAAFNGFSSGTPEVTVTDSAGRLTTYVLEASASGQENLAQVWDPGNPLEIVNGVEEGTPSESYTYWTAQSSSCDPAYLNQSATPDYSVLCSVRDADGHVTTFTYGPGPISAAPPMVASVETARGLAGTGSETTFAYQPSTASTVADTAAPATLAASGGCLAAGANCEQTLYAYIDSAGRVGQVDGGSSTGGYLTQTDYFWDGDSGVGQWGATWAQQRRNHLYLHLRPRQPADRLQQCARDL